MKKMEPANKQALQTFYSNVVDFDSVLENVSFFEETKRFILGEIKHLLFQKTAETLDDILLLVQQKKTDLSEGKSPKQLKEKTLKTIQVIEKKIQDIRVAEQAKKSNQKNPFCNLPKETLLSIFGFLNTKQRSTISLVNKKFNSLIRGAEFNLVWPKLLTNEFQQTITKTSDLSVSAVLDIVIFSNKIATLHKNGRIHLWDKKTGNFLTAIKKNYAITAMAKASYFHLYFGDKAGYIRIFDVEKNDIIKEHKFYDNGIRLLLNIDDNTLVMLVNSHRSDKNNLNQKYLVLDKKSFDLVEKPDSTNIDLASYSGNYLLAATRDKKIKLWRSKDFQLLDQFSINSEAFPKQLLMYDKNIIIRYSDHSVSITNLETKDNKTLETAGPLNAMNVFLHGYLVLAYSNGIIGIYNLKTEKFLNDIVTQYSITTIQTFSTNQILLGCSDGKVATLTLPECDYEMESTYKI